MALPGRQGSLKKLVAASNSPQGGFPNEKARAELIKFRAGRVEACSSLNEQRYQTQWYHALCVV
jgi:hypothetical protein